MIERGVRVESWEVSVTLDLIELTESSDGIT
jgi:hypothetical protein